MAHDFSIKIEKEDSKNIYFFGYCNGLVYKAFNCEEYNGIYSGINAGISISKKEAEQGVIEMLWEFNYEKHKGLYKNEYDKFNSFLHEVIKPSDDEQTFYIHFS
ncbi:hypothetical protein P5776_004387 [Vibrio parahaemolyticus]|nr:hypothetical protein [Vibrio parahaemolyticus]